MPDTNKDSETYGMWVKYVNEVPVGAEGSWLHDGVLIAVFNPETGDLSFHGVEGAEGGVIVLNTNATLASLAIVPEVMTSNLGMAIVENAIIVKWNETEDDEEPYFVASNDLVMTYRVNPTNAVIPAEDAFSFIERTVVTRVEGDSDTLLTVKSIEAVEGGIKVTAEVNELQPDAWYEYGYTEPMQRNEFEQTHTLVALRAEVGENAYVVSDYAKLLTYWFESFSIVNVYEGTEAEDEDLPWNHYCPTEVPAVDDDNCAEFVYTESIDLDEVVSLVEDWYEVFVEDYGFEVEYTFEQLEEYLGSDETNQQRFVKMDENNVVTVDKEFLKANPNGGRAAIGRTPVFKVAASVNDEVLAEAYIKLGIVDKEPEAEVLPDTIRVVEPIGNLEYSELDLAEKFPIFWERMNQEVYEVLAMSAVEFEQAYDEEKFMKPSSGKGGVGHEYVEKSEDPTATEAASIWFNPGKVALGADSVAIILTGSGAPVKIVFTYEITHETAFPALNEDYQIADITYVAEDENVTVEAVQTKGKLVDDAWKLQNTMKEFIEDYAVDYELPGNHTDLAFEVIGMLDADAELVEAEGYDLSDNTLDGELSLTTPLAVTEDYRIYVVEMTLTMANGDVCTKQFAVKFVRPFVMEVGDVVLKTTAAPTKADVMPSVVIKDFAGKVLFAMNTVDNPAFDPEHPNTSAVTAYAREAYKLDKDDFKGKFEFDLDAKGFGEGTLTIDANGVITWNNMGGDLQKNKTAKSVVKYTMEGIATAKAEGNVTVLSTENSKN